MAKYDSRELTSYSTKKYKSAQAAAKEASAIFNGMSIEEQREVGGGVIYDPETREYYFTYTLGEPKEGTSVEMRIGKPKSHQIVALWHTHGSDTHTSERFSKADTEIAKQLKVPIYMVDHSGRMKSWTPKKDARATTRTGASGSPVLEQGQPVTVRRKVGQQLFPEDVQKKLTAP